MPIRIRIQGAKQWWMQADQDLDAGQTKSHKNLNFYMKNYSSSK